jgi:hypothetical protein
MGGGADPSLRITPEDCTAALLPAGAAIAALHNNKDASKLQTRCLIPISSSEAGYRLGSSILRKSRFSRSSLQKKVSILT